MPRFHGLDAARAAAMLLGLFFHGAVSFMANDIGWAVRDRSRHVGVDAALWICHTFRMPVFFLLAGFFGRLLCEKRGPAGFLRHRARRLLIPFVVALLPLMPSLYALWLWGASVTGPRQLHPFGMSVPQLEAGLPPPSPCHLWFLYYLMMILLVLLGMSRLGRNLPMGAVDAALRFLLRFQLVPVVMAVATGVTLSFMKSLAADTPVSFLPLPQVLAYYAVFAGFGWLLHRQPSLVDDLGRRWWLPLIFAAGALVPLGRLVEASAAGNSPSAPLARAGALYLSAFFGWSLVTAFIGVFVRFASQPRTWISYLSDASYWCYIVHLPVVILFQILVARLEAPGPLKYLLVMAATIAICLGSYQGLVRNTFLGAALNGRRGRDETAPAAR